MVWVNGLGKGDTHSRAQLPLVLAGSCQGAFETGRFLTYKGDVPHNQRLVSLCGAMGLGVTSFGDPTYASGPRPGLAG